MGSGRTETPPYPDPPLGAFTSPRPPYAVIHTSHHPLSLIHERSHPATTNTPLTFSKSTLPGGIYILKKPLATWRFADTVNRNDLQTFAITFKLVGNLNTIPILCGVHND